MSEIEFDAILLAGGRASRLGGGDKTALVADGQTLLERSIEAAQDATTRVVVGALPDAVLRPGLVITREDPPWSGPASALAAGLRTLDEARSTAPFVLVLACDMPRVADAVAVILRAFSDLPETDGCIAVDDGGRRQPLLAIYRAGAVREALDGFDPVDASMRRLLAGLRLAEVAVASELVDDVDTPDDLRRLGVTRPASLDGLPGATG
ncbi:hypothetical protein AX769_05145 [Frondihabitans sp. PAMC 28766]|uniref:molybdenum cofactor guanylyltransferase n=1 Tax=Frondihabitans sp. PAMC 28766 TaxID=1795630 RepID=UPI00078C8F1B|nr:molybdenum cofactor guanylyltransferase [Frondihabitans sp. PAMC 28766]AMM19638.1 hypothetical protein AX769_05145 [Frondihabitans sp. PAMC 28766]